MKSSSTERMVKDLKILKKKGHLDFSHKISAVSNGEAVREDGTTYRAIPLGTNEFVKIKKTILSSAPVEQE